MLYTFFSFHFVSLFWQWNENVLFLLTLSSIAEIKHV